MPKDLNGAQVGTQRKSHVNEPKTKVFTGMTNFPMSYKMANTARYGHITPFYYQHSRGDDVVPLYSEHDLRTYTLQSPMLSDLVMSKSYFMVDMKSIYPNSWDLMFREPSKGDDVPENTRSISYRFLFIVKNLLDFFKQLQVEDEIYGDRYYQTGYFRFLFFLESIFSNGSLFSEFNIHLSDFLVATYNNDDGDEIYTNFDTWFDKFIGPNISLIQDFTVNNTVYHIHNGSSYYNETEEKYYVSPRRAIEIMRDNQFQINKVSALIKERCIVPVSYLKIRQTSVNGNDIDLEDYPINFEVLAAYQLGCAQFFTDSHIDFVYNADLLRSAMFRSADNVLRPFVGDGYYFFDYNSQRVLYDVFSGYIFEQVLGSLLDDFATYYHDVFNYFIMFFGHRNSLRYGDYFVTGRPNPLGIGDVSVDTSLASVSVVDITKKIQYQRFLNAVNLAFQDLGSYAKSVLGLDDAGDVSYDIPAFLGHKSLPIRGMEVENTAERQTDPNSITTILRSSNNVHAFELKTKRPCIIIGVYSFDVSRIYSKTFDRMHMHLDRYDDFIPQLQYVGDQSIFARELNALNPPDLNFAYAVRYMEYKQRYHYAAGGAISSLPSWFMITDGVEGDKLYSPNNITPDYIRSKPTEFDRFFSSLSGYSLGTYFHFIVLTTNHQTLTRKMEYAPEPLK